MQDNNNRKLDPALIDNAWLQMEKQLDQAMPQKKRRAVIWWWAGLAGLAILFLNIYLFSKDTGKPSVPIVEKEEAVVASTTSNNTVQSKQYEDVTPTEESSFSEDKPTEEVSINPFVAALNTDQVDAPAVALSIANNADHHSNTAAETDLIMVNGSLLEEESSHAITPVKGVDTEEEVASETPALALVPTTTPSESATWVTQQLPAISNLRIPLESSGSDFLLPIQPSKVQPISPWHYYLEGQGGFSLATTDYHSVAGGIGLQRDITKKWLAELGVQYQFNQRSLLIGNNADRALAEEFSGALGSGYAVERSLAFQNIQTSRWNLYLGSLYQLSPRITLGLAVQGSYISNATAVLENASVVVAEPSLDISDLRVDLYDSVLSVYELDPTTNSVSDPYPIEAKRWQLSMNSSLRYRFAQHWEATLQYQRHLTGWPSKEAPFGGLSAVQFGLRYYLR